MLSHPYFYHSSIRKAIALVGTLFNDITIQRTDKDGTLQVIKVPCTLGPREKFMVRYESDSDLANKASMTLPRIAFSMTNATYDGKRKLDSKLRFGLIQQSNTAYDNVRAPVPYTLDFEVSVLAERAGDAMKIAEQILPFFTPSWNPTVQLLEEFPDLLIDVPIVLESARLNDLYEGDFKDRRLVTWDFNLTMPWYMFGPVSTAKVIKFAQVNTHISMDADSPTATVVTVQPGLTANGEPTTNVGESISYLDINEDDDWGYIVTITDEWD